MRSTITDRHGEFVAHLCSSVDVAEFVNAVKGKSANGPSMFSVQADAIASCAVNV